MITIDKPAETKNGKVRVTFAAPATEDCGCLYLVGRFGNWKESVYRMQCAEDGTWSLTLELEPGCEYQYRFRTLKGTWLNDPTSLMVPLPFQRENSMEQRSSLTG